MMTGATCAVVAWLADAEPGLVRPGPSRRRWVSASAGSRRSTGSDPATLQGERQPELLGFGQLQRGHKGRAAACAVTAVVAEPGVNQPRLQAVSIYRKLGSSSRNQAVTRSRELGLLEG
jgi:hypothetical protein